MRLIRLANMLIAASLLLTACDRGEGIRPKVNGKANEQAPAQPATAANPSSDAQNDYLEKTRKEIDELRAKIDALADRAKKSGANVRGVLDAKSGEFKTELQAIEKKWRDVKAASAGAWQSMKQSLDDSIEELKKAVQRETEDTKAEK